MEFVRVSSEDGSWEKLLEQWEAECEEAGESFELFEPGAFSVLRPLAEEEQRDNAGVYALYDKENDRYDALCQLNTAMLPKTTGVTLRVRMSMLSPRYDFGETTITEYKSVLLSIIFNVWMITMNEMKEDHARFHVRSPADVEFFREFAGAIQGSRFARTVETRGSWLYMSH